MASRTRGNGYQCLLSYLEQQLFLHVSTFLSCRSGISEDPQRQDKCSDSCTRLVNPILVPVVVTDDHLGPVVFSAVTKKFDTAKQTLRELPARQKTAVNSNQGNNTAEKLLEAPLTDYLHIASITIKLNNGHLILKI